MDENHELIQQVQAAYDKATQNYKDQQGTIITKLNALEEEQKQAKRALEVANQGRLKFEESYKGAQSNPSGPNPTITVQVYREKLHEQEVICDEQQKILNEIPGRIEEVRTERKANQAALLQDTTYRTASRLRFEADPSYTEALKDDIDKTLTALKHQIKLHQQKQADAPNTIKQLKSALSQAKAALTDLKAARDAEEDTNKRLKGDDEKRLIEQLGGEENAKGQFIKGKISEDRQKIIGVARSVVDYKTRECTALEQEINQLQAPLPESNALKAARAQFDFAVERLTLARGAEPALHMSAQQPLHDTIQMLDDKKDEARRIREDIQALQTDIDKLEADETTPTETTSLLSFQEYKTRLDKTRQNFNDLTHELTKNKAKKAGNWDWWNDLCDYCTKNILGRLTDIELSEQKLGQATTILTKVESIYEKAVTLNKIETTIDQLSKNKEAADAEVQSQLTSQAQLLTKLETVMRPEMASLFSTDPSNREKARDNALEQTREATHELLEHGREITRQGAEFARKGAEGFMTMFKQGLFASQPETQQENPPKSKAQPSAPKATPKVDKAHVQQAVAAVASSLADFLKNSSQANLILLQDSVKEHPTYTQDAKFQDSLEQAKLLYSELEDLFPTPQKAPQAADKTAAMRQHVKEERIENNQEEEKKPKPPEINRGRYGGGRDA